MSRLPLCRLAKALQVALGTSLTTVRRVIKVDGGPVAYMLDIAPASILSPRDIDKAFNGSVLDLLRQRPNLTVTRAVANIVAVNADEKLADMLQIQIQQALLLLQETLLSGKGVPVEFSQKYLVPEYFQLHIVRC